MTAFAGEIWLVDQPSERLSGEVELDSSRLRVSVDRQEIALWNREVVVISETVSCFELRAGGETLCFAPITPSLFRQDVFPESEDTTGTRFREAYIAAARKRWSKKRSWVAAGLATPIILLAASSLGQAADPATTTITTAVPVATVTSAAPRLTSTTVAVLQETLATVASITDGDTFRALLTDGSNQPVRLIGIDAPEPGQAGGTEASALLESLISGQTVRLVPDVSDRDRFGRLLRYVFVDEVFINEAMVESGLAESRRYPPDIAMAEILEEAQRRAPSSTTAPQTTTTTAAPATTAVPTTTAATATTTTPTITSPPVANCHASYLGECLTPGIGDYDCASGSGNGPNYVYGTVQVVGPDEFDLDREGDGLGCESN